MATSTQRTTVLTTRRTLTASRMKMAVQTRTTIGIPFWIRWTIVPMILRTSIS